MNKINVLILLVFISICSSFVFADTQIIVLNNLTVSVNSSIINIMLNGQPQLMPSADGSAFSYTQSSVMNLQPEIQYINNSNICIQPTIYENFTCNPFSNTDNSSLSGLYGKLDDINTNMNGNFERQILSMQNNLHDNIQSQIAPAIQNFNDCTAQLNVLRNNATAAYLDSYNAKVQQEKWYMAYTDAKEQLNIYTWIMLGMLGLFVAVWIWLVRGGTIKNIGGVKFG